jgi:pimeloyl-ACP methyl ester carboxylesterase
LRPAGDELKLGQQAFTYSLQTIRVPTLVIHGSDDPLVIPTAGHDVASNIPQARFVFIEGMGHTLAPGLTARLADLILSNVTKKP